MINTIHGLGTATKIVALICSILLLVGACFSLIGAIVLLSLPNRLVDISVSSGSTVIVRPSEILKGDLFNDWMDQKDKITQSITEGDKSLTAEIDDNGDLTIVAGIIEGGVTLRQLGVNCLVWALWMTALSIVFRFLSILGKTISVSPSPFCNESVKGLQNVGISLLVWTFGPSLIGEILFTCFRINKGMLVSAPSINLPTVILILVFVLLIFVFKYGVRLQDESDHTL